MTREEIAERLATLGYASVIDTGEVQRIAAAVRALPVLATCGECRHLVANPARAGLFVANPARAGLYCNREKRALASDAECRPVAPPSWCPLRGKR